MAETRRLIDTRVVQPAQTAVALKLITEMDFLRLKAIARLYARGLPADVGWDDLLQEALTRVIVGTRKPPDGVPMIAFIAGIIRSLRSEHWRRARRGGGAAPAVSIDRDPDRITEAALVDPAPDAERWLVAQQALQAIERLFAEDRTALQIIAGIGRGLTPEQICDLLRISKTDYDSARKRMRRKLLREGLTCAE